MHINHSTASRYVALFGINGEDDFFSSDLNNDELKERLGHVGKISKKTGLRLLAAYSGKDEYVPESIDGKMLLKRLVEAMNNGEEADAAQGLFLENANHNISEGSGDKDIFVQEVGQILSTFSNSN
jgi:hypothetical protein